MTIPPNKRRTLFEIRLSLHGFNEEQIATIMEEVALVCKVCLDAPADICTCWRDE